MKSIIDSSYPFQFRGKNEQGSYIYDFDSIGEKRVKKRVKIFILFKARPDIFNLGLVNEELTKAGNLIESDTSTTNNIKDWDKVLNTVFLCGIDFLRAHNWAYLLFFGNSIHKQIIYKRKITANLKELEQEFIVYGGFAKYGLAYQDYNGNTVLPTDSDFTQKKYRLNKIPVNVEFTGYELFKKEKSKEYDFIFLKLIYP